MQRYVCPDCLRTFQAEERCHDWVCWNCGDILMVIGAEDKELARMLSSRSHDEENI